MRGDLSLHLRMLVRPHAVVGLVGMVSGVTALASAYLPWYDVTATVDMLDVTGRRAVSSLAAWQAHPWGWIVPALALTAMLGGLALAVDRPAPVNVLLGSGIGLATTVVGGGLLFPPVSRFDVAGTRLRELAGLADRLPQDVEMSFAVRPSIGLWLTLAAAGLVIAAGLAARDEI